MGPGRVLVSPARRPISMVPTTQSADLRAYYSKHTETTTLDSKLLARLPLLHANRLLHRPPRLRWRVTVDRRRPLLPASR
ncbi:hypothetical protein ACX9NE_23955 [Mycobacterium sp. ML4]